MHGVRKAKLVIECAGGDSFLDLPPEFAHDLGALSCDSADVVQRESDVLESRDQRRLQVVGACLVAEAQHELQRVRLKAWNLQA